MSNDEKERQTSESDSTPIDEIEAGKMVTSELAWMDEDGIICIRTVNLVQGETGREGWEEIRPGEKSYEEAKKQYGLSKPGDRYKNRSVTDIAN